ncbi:MAG: FtsW/RodA/SpoVE family cell cycle protein, partial [Merdibacter sp.]|nr:FtsW/RodA/SpoVE family cell cycle protein [Merdibacter sp.]
MFSRRCRVLTLEVLLLVVIGIVMVASSSRVWAEYKFDDPFYYAWRQGIFALIGLGCMFVCAHIPIRLLRKHARLLFWLSTATLVLVLIPGLGVMRNGSRSWFGIGSFLIQPSEFFK